MRWTKYPNDEATRRRAIENSRRVRAEKKQLRIQQVRQLTINGLKPKAIAPKLGVTLKTVYRALETLREKGEID